MNIGPCMCGAIDCRSCGPAQGYPWPYREEGEDEPDEPEIEPDPPEYTPDEEYLP
jgi:hypothetical protein